MHIIGISNYKFTGIHTAWIDYGPIFIPVQDYTRWFHLLEQLEPEGREWSVEAPAVRNENMQTLSSLLYRIVHATQQSVFVLHLHNSHLTWLCCRQLQSSLLIKVAEILSMKEKILQQFALEIALRIQRELKTWKKGGCSASKNRRRWCKQGSPVELMRLACLQPSVVVQGGTKPRPLSAGAWLAQCLSVSPAQLSAPDTLQLWEENLDGFSFGSVTCFYVCHRIPWN